MFAKVFGQIFDSSIAEDYNCRRMFMDLLVLSDPTGAVDMTHEAISRRTNVPLEEVVKYIAELCQPDAKSRSAMEEGKRLIPLDPNRDWGWKIVNYSYYRKIKNQEALREYFREKQRDHRAKKKAVKDTCLTSIDNVEQPLTSLHTPSSSTSSSAGKRKPKSLEELYVYAAKEGISKSDANAFNDSMEAGGWTRNGKAIRDWEAHLRSYKANGYLASQKQSKNGRPPAMTELDNRLERDPLWQEQQQKRRAS
jgi:hypothetical protein